MTNIHQISNIYRVPGWSVGTIVGAAVAFDLVLVIGMVAMLKAAEWTWCLLTVLALVAGFGFTLSELQRAANPKELSDQAKESAPDGHKHNLEASKHHEAMDLR